jgi:DNA-directed RNA polymerase subunit RPC12/RpoP
MLLLRLTLLYRSLRRRWLSATLRADPKDWCPSCGVRRLHAIQYSDAHGAVIHTCSRCGARWGKRCLIAPERWRVKERE